MKPKVAEYFTWIIYIYIYIYIYSQPQVFGHLQSVIFNETNSALQCFLSLYEIQVFLGYFDISITRYVLKKLIWRRFSSLLLSMNKTFPKSYIIPPLELTLDYIVLNFYLLDTTRFT